MCKWFVFRSISNFGRKRKALATLENLLNFASIINRLLYYYPWPRFRLLRLRCLQNLSLQLNHNVKQNCNSSIRVLRSRSMTTIESLSKVESTEGENVERESKAKVGDSQNESCPNPAVPVDTETEASSVEALILKKAQKLGIDPSKLSNRAKKRMRRSVKSRTKKQSKKLRKLNHPDADLSAGYNHKIFEDTDYYFENGLRKVYPYYFTFTAYTKERWIGRHLLEVFTKEFKGGSHQYYRSAIETGSMTVNGRAVGVDYKLGPSDLIAHKLHRHENPVCDHPLEILHEDEDVLVINKPSSIPCHPCGRYRFNSIVFILGKEMKRANLRNIYRLDRLTSGVLVCAKTAKRTAQLEKHVISRNVQKEYVCRVDGEFPDGQVTVDKPLDVLSNTIAVWKVSANGKPSQTIFEKMSYNGKSSVVKCFPKTGRTHQIRVHLQYLGYPILNDPIYNCTAFGPEKGKGGNYGQTEEEVIKAIERIHNVGEWADGESPLFARKMAESRKTSTPQGESINLCTTESETTSCDGAKYIDRETINEPLSKRQKLSEKTELSSECEQPATSEHCSSTVPRPGFDLDKWVPDVNCVGCQTNYIDPSPENLVMYLHALRYKGPDWDYSTDLPDWAGDDFNENTDTWNFE